MGTDMFPFHWRRDGPVLLFALLFPSLGTWLYFVAFAGRGAVMGWTYGICKTLQFILPVFWVVVVQKERPDLRRLFAWRGVGMALAFGLAVVAGMLLLYHGHLCNSPVMVDVPDQIWNKIAAIGIDTPGAFLGMAVFIAGLHSFFEEYYWRWFVFGQLRRAMPLGAAVAVSAVGFALHHVIVLGAYFPDAYFWTAAIFFSVCVALGGCVWAWLYQRSGSLLGPWLSHLLVDAGIMWLGFVLCRGHFA